MKKLFLLVVILFTTLSLSAEASWAKASSVIFNFGDGYGKWETCILDIKIDADQKVITIYSKDLQILYLQTANNVYYSDYEVLQCDAIDYDNKICKIYFYHYKDGNVFLELRYIDVFYMYNIKLL